MGAYQAGGQLQFLHRSKALELWGLSAISLLERREGVEQQDQTDSPGKSAEVSGIVEVFPSPIGDSAICPKGNF